MIYLQNTDGKSLINPTLIDIQKAFNNLLLSRSTDSNPNKSNYISLMNESELTLEIYKKTIILQDYGNYPPDDGPGGPGEILRIRVEEGCLFPKLEEVIDALYNYEVKKLVKILNSLPKTK